MPNEKTTKKLQATFRDDKRSLQLWLSPNQFGTRACDTVEQARKMITETGIDQTLRIASDE